MYGSRRVMNRLPIAAAGIAITLLACVFLVWQAVRILAAGHEPSLAAWTLAIAALIASAGVLAYASRLVPVSARRDTESQLAGVIDSVADLLSNGLVG